VLGTCCCLAQTLSSLGRYNKTAGYGIAAISRVTVAEDWPVAGYEYLPRRHRAYQHRWTCRSDQSVSTSRQAFANIFLSLFNLIQSSLRHKSHTFNSPCSVAQKVTLSLSLRHTHLYIFISILLPILFPAVLTPAQQPCRHAQRSLKARAPTLKVGSPCHRLPANTRDILTRLSFLLLISPSCIS
jgi:hypothetical protein